MPVQNFKRWQRRVSRCADDVNELPMGKRACSGGAVRADRFARRGFDPRRPQPRGSPEVTTLNRAAPSRSHRTPRLPTSIPKYWKGNHLNTLTSHSSFSHSSFDFTLIGNLCGQLASSYQGISDTFVQWRRVPACGIIASTH